MELRGSFTWIFYKPSRYPFHGYEGVLFDVMKFSIFVNSLLKNESGSIQPYLPKPFHTEDVLSKHDIRAAYYRAMRQTLCSVIEGRTSQLSFDEKTSITSQFGPIDWVTETHNKLPLFQLYTKMFSEWEKQMWLNLPAYEGKIPTE